MPSPGAAARPLPSLQSAELLLGCLVDFFTFSFHKLKIARMKASFNNLFSPFSSFYNHLSDSCLILNESHDHMTVEKFTFPWIFMASVPAEMDMNKFTL